MEHYNVIIIGGGPAGATCGYILNKNKINCLIIDKNDFPREKLCGGGLTPKAYELLDSIYSNFNYDYEKLYIASFFYNGKKMNDIQLKKEIRTVERRIFDNGLISEYLNHNGLFIKDEINKIEEKDKIVITLSSGKSISCDYLIGADGTLSFVRRYLEPDFLKGILCLEQHNENYKLEKIVIGFDDSFDNGYYFAFPNKNYTAVGYGDKKTNLNEFDKQLVKYNVISNNSTKGAYIPMLVGINYKLKKNIIVIGDAGSYVDSITGEGLYYAIKTGQNAALSIMNNVSFKKQNKKIIKRIKLKRLMAMFVYSKIGKTITKGVLKSNLMTRKLINWYLNF